MTSPVKIPSNNAPQESQPTQTSDMRASRCDLVSGLFLTLILFLGVIVSGLFLLWTLHRWATQAEIHHSSPTRTEFLSPADGAAEGGFAVPSPDEYAALQEPSLDSTLAAVSDAVKETTPSLDALQELSSSTSGHGRIIVRVPEDGTEEIIPRSERWQLNFSATDVQSYAAQLDFFRIELGVFGGGVQGIALVGDLPTNPTNRHEMDSAQVQRLYFMWSGASPLKKMEESLLQQAGVQWTARQRIHLIPMQLENDLAYRELEFARIAGHDRVTEIAKTVFQCVPTDTGYEFRIADQRYR